MKISNEKPGYSADPAAPLSGPQSAQAGALRPSVAGGEDQITVSADARLLQIATEQASHDTGVRADVVERMRALMADGKLGADTSALADAIIDNWLAGPQAMP